MKIFVSHSTADRELVQSVVDLLELGVGVPHGDIFCSSISGSIPNGAFFVQHILKKLATADLVVSVLSTSYFERAFCLEEAGAGLVRQIAGNSTYYSLLVPPANFPDLQAALYGLQSGSILDPKPLNDLYDLIKEAGVTVKNTTLWTTKRDAFLVDAKQIVAMQSDRESLQELAIQDVWFEITSPGTYRYDVKLRIVILNNTGHDVEVSVPTWVAEPSDVPFQSLPNFGSSLQVEAVGGWRLGKWQDESGHIYVNKGLCFRVWIGLDPSFNDANDLRRRHETLRIGTLVLPLKGAGFDVIVEKRL